MAATIAGFKRAKSSAGATAAGAGLGAAGGSGNRRLTARDIPRMAKMSSSRNTSTKPMPRNIRVKPSPNRVELCKIKPQLVRRILLINRFTLNRTDKKQVTKSC